MSEDVFSTVSPLDGSELAPVEATPVADIAELCDQARAAQAEWATLEVGERVERLLGLKKRVLERAEEIAELVHREVGKPVEEAVLAEVLPNADLVDYWCDAIEELLEGSNVDLDPLSYPSKRGRVHRDPRGLVALITPWNYPVAIPLRTLVPALLSGNAVVFKPSEITPRCGALVASLFDGLLPQGLLVLAQGGADVGAAVVTEADAVVFTGSVSTGRKVAVACAERFVPCSLELGGKDAAIVLADCNLERTAQGVVWGAFTNAGQNCAGIERVYVDKSIAKRFIARVVEIAKTFSKAGVDTATLTTLEQRRTVSRHLADAVESGAEILVGGDPEEDDALAYPPTVLQVTADADERAFMCEETFGPVMPIVVVDDVDSAVERVNASRFALTTSVWTKRIRFGHELARRLRSGVVTVNNHAFTAALPMAPWTGTGDSGHGVTNSPHALGALTRARFVLEDRNRAARELWWYPYTPVLRTIAFAMARLRGGAGFFGRLAALLQLITAIPKRLLGG